MTKLTIPTKKAENSAIVVRDASKNYGSTKAISNLNMTVPEGSIYSLLGASGSGKTTILSCVVGIRKLNSGSIDVFGFEPGDRGSGIPGSRVGYMPQEISLFEEFSIKEALFYFGQIYGMSNGKIIERMIFLLKFLNIENDHSQLIRNLSGGQKRRVSFAIALIHEPELLILDEPTVGVDPLLRKTIWEYLTKLSSSKKTTIIVTTHFIEEANESSTVGLMRNGRLIAEDDPNSLKRHYETDLEKIVLKLCLLDSDKYITEESMPKKTDRKNSKVSNEILTRRQIPWNEKSSFYTRLRALVNRNVIRLWRNIIYLIFLFLMPSGATFLFCVALGGEIKNLQFGIVNFDTNHSICETQNRSCGGENISCAYLSQIPEDDYIWTYYTSEESATEAVQLGQIWGYIKFPEKFSKNFPYTDDEEINRSDKYKISIKMDMTNEIIAQTVYMKIFESFQNFMKKWVNDCYFAGDFFQFPLVFGDPIYGHSKGSYMEYVAPSFYLVIVLFMAVTLTGEVFVNEKKQGMFERSLVSGVSRNEIILSHFITQFGVLFIQIALSLTILFVIFEIPILGSIYEVIAITILQGTIGMLLGLVFSILFDDENDVLQLSMGFIMPNLILAGVLWPVEGMSLTVQTICRIFPTSLAGESLRSIISRGWSMTHSKVWPGFVSSLICITSLWLIIIFVNRNSAKKL